MLLSDEVLLQVRLSSDDLDGVTLRELVELFITLLQTSLAILEFMARTARFIFELAALPGRIWYTFWFEVANWALGKIQLRAWG
jgi:hypothetical protein